MKLDGLEGQGLLALSGGRPIHFLGEHLIDPVAGGGLGGARDGGGGEQHRAEGGPTKGLGGHHGYQAKRQRPRERVRGAALVEP